MPISRPLSPPGSSRRWGLACALLLAALSLPATAQWVWRDTSGRVTASDRPPPHSVPEKDIISRPAANAARRNTAPVQAAASAASAAAPALAASKGGLQAEVEARKRAADQAAAAKTKAEADQLAAQRADNCTRARQHVATLESGIRITRMNDKGEREFLDDKARAAEMERARGVATRDCN